MTEIFPQSRCQLVRCTAVGAMIGFSLAYAINRVAQQKFHALRTALLSLSGGAVGALIGSRYSPKRPCSQAPSQERPLNTPKRPLNCEPPPLPKLLSREKPLTQHQLHEAYTTYKNHQKALNSEDELKKLGAERDLQKKGVVATTNKLNNTNAKIAILTDLASLQDTLKGEVLDIVLIKEEVSLTREQLESTQLYLPETKTVSLQGAPLTEADLQKLVQLCPTLEKIEGAEIASEIRFLNTFNLDRLRNQPNLQTIVMPKGAWERVPDKLNLCGVPPMVCGEILRNKPGIREVAMDTVSIRDLCRWKQLGWLNRVQKIDLSRCTDLTTNVYTPLSQLPAVAIIELPKDLPRGDWKLPQLTDLILIRELYAKRVDLWTYSSPPKCSPFWASVPNKHGAQLPEKPFGPSRQAVLETQKHLKHPLSLNDEKFLGADTPALQERSVWLLQDQCNKKLFLNLWPIVNEERYEENYPVRALKLSLRLWAEAQWPEWVLNRTLSPHVPEKRFNPRDSEYCDFEATIVQKNEKESVFLHKQVIANQGSNWERDMLKVPSYHGEGNQIAGLLGVSALSFKPGKFPDQIEYRSDIENPAAYKWAFALAYHPEAVEDIPEELLDQVLSIAHEYQYPEAIIQKLHQKIKNYLQQFPLDKETIISLPEKDYKKIARMVAAALPHNALLKDPFTALVVRGVLSDKNFVAQVLVGRFKGEVQKICLKEFDNIQNANELNGLNQGAIGSLLAALSEQENRHDQLKVRLTTRQQP